MYLGIDLGTSGVKAILVDAAQNQIGSATGPLKATHLHSGWSEQSPSDWIAATKLALAKLRETNVRAFGAVRSLGLAGQMHGATLLDADDNVLRPCILWNDTRSHHEAKMLDDDKSFRRITGNVLFPGFTAPKLIWVRAHEPGIFDRTAKVLLPKDYLRLWLAGEYCTDPSDASGTGWLDTKNRSWSPELLARCDLTIDHMPRIVEGSQASGGLKSDVAQQLGLPTGVIVAGGGSDNAATAIATNVVEKGEAFLSIGSSGVLFVSNDGYHPNSGSAIHTFCHAIPDKWHQMGVILSAANALKWWSSIVNRDPKFLTKELGENLKTPSDALFLPYLSGERTPHNDAKVRAGFHNLGNEMGRAELTQALLEGVAFAFRDNLLALRQTGAQVDRATVVGGGQNSEYWLKLIATTLKVPLNIPAYGEVGAAFGAARLAMLATGDFSMSEVFQHQENERTILPDVSAYGEFDDAYGRFKAAYPGQS